uniref:Charged multivesicular body protein 6 n=2 Tax=Cyprinus carpio TaxID=7962 RepID=A0A8C1E1M1_CYPCA
KVNIFKNCRRNRRNILWGQLKQQRDKLKQYQKKIALQLEKETSALLLLKKKCYQDQLLYKTDIQVQDIEFAQIEIKIIEGLKAGNYCLKQMHEVMSIEEVDRILEETQEATEYQKQIDELLAGSLTAEDEDAVLAELEAITQGEDITLPELPTDPLPVVPTGETGVVLLLSNTALCERMTWLSYLAFDCVLSLALCSVSLQKEKRHKSSRSERCWQRSV